MIRLINIEDSEVDYELIIYHLKKGGFSDLESVRVQTIEDLRIELEKKNYDLVICDYNVPGVDPMNALSIVREYSPYLPFIIVSGLVGEESVADMMNAGVEDFVIKSRLERLAKVVKRALREFEVQVQEAKSRAIAKKAFLAKEEMLAIVYHDIKNPLAAILLDAQMLELLSYKKPDLEVMSDLRLQSRRILRTVNRLKKLVSDLLLHNSAEQPGSDSGHSFVIHPSFYNPQSLVNEVIDSYRPLISEKMLTIKQNIQIKSNDAYFDKERIYQVISNLLGNSLKFTPRGGEIVVELIEEANGEFNFSISDNGPGINESDLSKIFDKYWTSGSGNGLGLFICKSIVEAHGGVINAFSKKGQGARFSFNLPFRDFKEFNIHEKISNDKNQTLVKSLKNIYVIDDDEDLREVICWALEKVGFRVFSYNNAEEALKDLNHTFYPPNLIILDFHMEKMNGNEFLLKKASIDKRAGLSCPVVMISAAPNEAEKIIDPGMISEILNKPLDLNKLISSVEHFVF